MKIRLSNILQNILPQSKQLIPYGFYLPYFILLIIGIDERYKIGSDAFLYPDSNSYLLPAVLKKASGVWYLGDRPLQYLQFLYLTIGDGKNFVQTPILIQQMLGIAGGIFLVIAWVVYISAFNGHKLIYHAIGWFMAAVYFTSPLLMFYEKLIEPESISMFFMSLLICGMSIAYHKNTKANLRLVTLSILLFVNFYLTNPMTKWMFAAIGLEIAFTFSLFRIQSITLPRRILAFAVPIFLCFVLVWLPQKNVPGGNKNFDRYYVELNQMVYTHFSILMDDRNDFILPDTIIDSLNFYYNQSRRQNAHTLLGFNNDDLMAGKASSLIVQHYKYNFDALEQFYYNLNCILITKYPFELARDILKQLGAFYIPNKIIHKELYTPLDLCSSYQQSLAVAESFDNWERRLPKLFPNKSIKLDVLKNHTLGDYFSSVIRHNCGKNFSGYNSFWASGDKVLNKYFDYVFLLSVALYFLFCFCVKRLDIQVLSLSIFAIFVYTITIAIVHTFDVQRFITTIYPFLIFVPFASVIYCYQSLFYHKN